MIPKIPRLGQLQIVKEAFATAQQIPNKKDLTHVLASLKTYVSESARNPMLQDVPRSIRQVQDNIVIANGQLNELTEFVLYLAMQTDQGQNTAYNDWVESVHDLATYRRKDMPANVQVLIPFIVVLGGPETATRIVDSIIDVGLWWP